MYITEQPILTNEFLQGRGQPHCGALACFFGMVRNEDQGKRVLRLHYDCYVPMAEKEIAKIVTQLKAESGVAEIRVQHRIGLLEIGEIAVAIAVYSPHRQEAFAACRAVIDAIKQTVPIWKKESYVDGSSSWVACHHDHP